jgi:uncharacterized protein
MKFMLELLKILIFGFICVGVLAAVFQGKMIFAPQPTAPEIKARFNHNEYHFENSGIRLSGWFFKDRIGPNTPLIVYYGGNAEDIFINFHELGKFNTGAFLFMNHRGYGDSGGSPSEKALFADALAVFDHVLETEGIDPQNVVLMGRSLGSGVAVHVASHRRVAGVILVTPFDSLTHVARIHYPFLPVKWLLRL